MAKYLGKTWKKEELLACIGDPRQIAGIRPFVLSDGKAEGVKAASVNTGAGLTFMVLPGRVMDIPEAFYNGKPLHFAGCSGITSPAYFEEPGLGWLRSFFVGLLTTCGITYSGPPDEDQGKPLGLHGRISNTGAESVGIDQRWEGDEYVLSLQGTVRESSTLEENMALTRRIETKLGEKGFRLVDVIENRGFEAQPLMMLYHFNYGYPLLGPRAKVVGPVLSTEPLTEESKQGKNLEECLSYPEPQVSGEMVYYHDLGADQENKTFIALLNSDIGDGTPLGIILRFNKNELPYLLQWKSLKKGSYVTELGPGTAYPLTGRGKLREQNKLPMIQAHEQYKISMDFQVVDTIEAFEAITEEAKALC